jgi:cyclic pyranopterin phosphate synthase
MDNQIENIVDKYGRVHDYLRISLTERCNLRCFYCMPAEGIELRDKAEFMSSEELLAIAKVFVELGVKKIRLTGGEPLVKRGFDDLIQELAKLPIEIALTTNAILVDSHLDALIKAGIKNINVSLDSLKEERFNTISRRSYFQKIKENISLLLENDFNVKINVVLMRDVNDDEIIDFVEWSRTEKIHIRFIEFMPFDGNNWNLEKKVSLKEIIDKVNFFYGADKVMRIEDAKNDTTKNYQIKGSIGSFGVISSVTNPFCSTCNRIRLTADGKIKNCLFSQSETDLLTEYRAGNPLKELILDAIHSKYKERGGFADFSNETVRKMKNRSMITIGG